MPPVASRGDRHRARRTGWTSLSSTTGASSARRARRDDPGPRGDPRDRAGSPPTGRSSPRTTPMPTCTAIGSGRRARTTNQGDGIALGASRRHVDGRHQPRGSPADVRNHQRHGAVHTWLARVRQPRRTTLRERGRPVHGDARTLPRAGRRRVVHLRRGVSAGRQGRSERGVRAGSWVAETLQTAADQGVVIAGLDVAGSGRRRSAFPPTPCATPSIATTPTASPGEIRSSSRIRPSCARSPRRRSTAVELRAAVAVVTGYGVRIDADARVVDHDDRPIPGLYAAGEVTGNVLGEQYVGGGNAIGSALIFGRVAGRGARRRAGDAHGPTPSRRRRAGRAGRRSPPSVRGSAPRRGRRRRRRGRRSGRPRHARRRPTRPRRRRGDRSTGLEVVVVEAERSRRLLR